MTEQHDRARIGHTVGDGVPEQRELASSEGVVMQDRARHARAPPDPSLPTPLEIESRVATGMSVSTDATRVCR
jgi:hypothetical protein